jgi:hypothetical protein
MTREVFDGIDLMASIAVLPLVVDLSALTLFRQGCDYAC